MAIWGKVFTYATTVGEYIYSHIDATNLYEKKVKLLHLELDKRGTLESPAVRGYMEDLASTAHWGAHRNNFRKFYFVSIERLRMLPPDPRTIDYGHWR